MWSIEDVLKSVIGIVLICITTGAGFLFMCSSAVVFFFRKLLNKRPALLLAVAATISLLIDDLCFVIFNFTGVPCEMIMIVLRWIVLALTILSIAYDIPVIRKYYKSRKTN